MINLWGNQVQGVGEVIQLAVTPVFLLSGVATMLTVFTSRLARAVDRARDLERLVGSVPVAEHGRELHEPLATLAQRGRLLSYAIALATICALLVSIVVMVLFMSESFNFRVSYVINALFIAAMVSFIGAILCFLREVFLATSTLRIGLRQSR